MNDDKVSSLIAQANPDELKKIRMFKIRAEKLLSNTLVRDGFKSSADFRINDEGPSFSSFQLPSDEAFESLLMRFRHFWHKREPCNIFNILNIVNRYVPDARSSTQSLKKSWEKGLFYSTSIIIEDVPITSEKLIDLWLNAEFFHNDQDKQTELDNLIDKINSISPDPDFAKFLLIGSICECCNVIFELNTLLARLG